ncbi:uncharacterized protein [Procambarus clarkii]|uniref:uncharacterized protein isoform X6 n=1 Tax=Procambarus clarkii TaxID=6728 RepID=UPI003743CDE7
MAVNKQHEVPTSSVTDDSSTTVANLVEMDTSASGFQLVNPYRTNKVDSLDLVELATEIQKNRCGFFKNKQEKYCRRLRKMLTSITFPVTLSRSLAIFTTFTDDNLAKSISPLLTQRSGDQRVRMNI